MTSAYLAYKREDEVRIGRIASALERCEVPIWWDRSLPGGDSWREHLDSRLKEAGCVVVFWSYASTGPDNYYVLDEARRGMDRGVLVPVLIDPVEIPLGFGEFQAIDLVRWKGQIADPFFQDLLAVIRAKLAGEPAPKPRGPLYRVRRRIAYSVLSGAGLSAIVAFSLNAFGTASRVCTMPGLQPSLSDGCGAIGLGDRPSRRERLAWATIPAGSCSALREHVRRFPDGVYRSQAADLIAARRTTTTVRWAETSRDLSLYVPAEGAPAPTEMQARRQAEQRAIPDATRICKGFGATTLFRFRTARAIGEQWTCEPHPSGWVCGFQGSARCGLAAREVIEQESCGR